jgi:hypothetical protein
MKYPRLHDVQIRHVLCAWTGAQAKRIDLRTMLDQPPGSIGPDPEPGRHRVFTGHGRHSWIVIVEPDIETEVLVIISVFLADKP